MPFCVSDDCLPLGVKIFDTRLFWARGVTPDGVYGEDLARVDGVLGLNCRQCKQYSKQKY